MTTHRRLAPLALALSLGVTIGASTNACLLPEACILVIAQGKDWCTAPLGALMWPVGEPDLAVPVINDATGRPAVGCSCFNAAEQEILWAEAPAEVFSGFVVDIEQAARNECDVLVPPGWDHNCYSNELEFRQVYPGDDGTCVGSCHFNGPKCPEPGEINPYECDDLYGDGGDTGGGETGAGLPPAQPPIQTEELEWQL